ncbi:MAG: glycosyltransferase, partial [Candidatus Tectimicrobiota bacterium]
DLVLADCSSMAQYVRASTKPKIVDFVDIDSEKWQAYSRDSTLPYSLIYTMEYHRLSLFEERVTQTFDYCLVVSEEEKKLLKYGRNVVVMPNGIDCQFFTPRQEQNAHTLIFTGAMDYFPNIDGVSYFHRDIWPLVKAQVEDATFVVAGMQPHARIKALASNDTTITGFVPDIRDPLAQATICVVPLRIAKGIQNKVLEAMAMGIPVVATSAANTGIHAQDGQHILLADSPQAFAQAVVRLLNDVHLRRTLAANARRFVQEHFSWEKHLGTLDALIEQLTRARH